MAASLGIFSHLPSTLIKNKKFHFCLMSRDAFNDMMSSSGASGGPPSLASGDFDLLLQTFTCIIGYAATVFFTRLGYESILKCWAG